jgi:hypothetical protein
VADLHGAGVIHALLARLAAWWREITKQDDDYGDVP